MKDLYRISRLPPPPVSPFAVFAAALSILAINLVIPKLGVLLGIVFVVWPVWASRAEYIPSLLLIQLSRDNFGTVGANALSSDLGGEPIRIAGVPMSIQYMLGFMMVARVTYELFRSTTFRRPGILTLLLLWYAAMPFAAIMAVMGKFESNPSWTGTIRTMFMAGSFFYGLILSRTWPSDGRVVFRWLVPMITVMFFLARMEVFYHRFLFMFAPLGIPFAFFTMRRPGAGWKILGATCAALVFAWGMAIGMAPASEVGGNGAAGETISMGDSTFTMRLLVLVSILLCCIRAIPVARLRAFVTGTVGWGAFPVVLIFTLAIAILSPHMVHSGAMPERHAVEETMTLKERLLQKIFDDRSVIWNAALSDITSPPYVLRPAGRPLIINHPFWGVVEWKPGAHNTILEALKSLRWVAGLILLAIVAVVPVRCARALYAPSSPSIAMVAAGTLTTAIIGCVTGHYPITDNGAFIFFGFAGLCVSQIDSITTRGSRPLDEAGRRGRSVAKVVPRYREGASGLAFMESARVTGGHQ